MSERIAMLELRFAAGAVRRRWRQFLLVFVVLSVALWASLQLLAVRTAFRREMERDLRMLGWRVINVHPDPRPHRFLGHRLEVADVEAFARLAGGTAAPAALVTALARPAGAEPGSSREAVAVAIATTASWNDVVGLEFTEGRFFRPGETDACVLDAWIERRLFPSSARERAVVLELGGKTLSLRVVGVTRDPFRIRERFEEWDILGSARSPFVRFVEHKNVYLPREAIGSGDAMLAAVVRVGPGVDPAAGTAAIREYLAEKGSTAVAWSRKEWSRQILGALDVAGALTDFIWVTILAVTALMVVTVVAIIVRERQGEIAVRRVEGARRPQITGQLVLENGLLVLAAGAAAWLVCIPTSAWLEESLLGWPVPVRIVDVVTIVAAAVAIVSLTTLVPARRAASLDPVTVLREAGR